MQRCSTMDDALLALNDALHDVERERARLAYWTRHGEFDAARVSSLACVIKSDLERAAAACAAVIAAVLAGTGGGA